ncbi:Leucine Rich repeats (2 copies) [Maioricimonas rarisocia]|uniref:Leucine Rich repeats (2 copies) n=1 Tax=Maioricimonas rarisocia TaxID=2528026 RepID=A0A517Z853_9PLAN|nr:hypothetical protein [Maioricimonas rarisocia]QDU38629.1 Leucine Rich repeats (2 copies) [Maioricimonas rarisocia]
MSSSLPTRITIVTAAAVVIILALTIAGSLYRARQQLEEVAALEVRLHTAENRPTPGQVRIETEPLELRVSGIPAGSAQQITRFEAYEPVDDAHCRDLLKLSDLEFLRFDGQTLDASAGTALSRMPRLQHLALVRCTLEGDWPSFAEASQLEILILDGASFEPATLSGLCDAPSLRKAHFDGCDLGDATLPQIVEHAPGLTVLELSRTEVTSDCGHALRRLPELRQLHLVATGIDDRIMQDVAALPVLEELWISDTAISDEGLAALSGHPNLRLIAMDACRNVTSDAVTLLETMPALQEVYAGGTGVAGQWQRNR